jgi:hypothetical protein
MTTERGGDLKFVEQKLKLEECEWWRVRFDGVWVEGAPESRLSARTAKINGKEKKEDLLRRRGTLPAEWKPIIEEPCLPPDMAPHNTATHVAEGRDENISEETFAKMLIQKPILRSASAPHHDASTITPLATHTSDYLSRPTPSTPYNRAPTYPSPPRAENASAAQPSFMRTASHSIDYSLERKGTGSALMPTITEEGVLGGPISEGSEGSIVDNNGSMRADKNESLESPKVDFRPVAFAKEEAARQRRRSRIASMQVGPSGEVLSGAESGDTRPPSTKEKSHANVATAKTTSCRRHSKEALPARRLRLEAAASGGGFWSKSSTYRVVLLRHGRTLVWRGGHGAVTVWRWTRMLHQLLRGKSSLLLRRGQSMPNADALGTDTATTQKSPSLEQGQASETDTLLPPRLSGKGKDRATSPTTSPSTSPRRSWKENMTPFSTNPTSRLDSSQGARGERLSSATYQRHSKRQMYTTSGNADGSSDASSYDGAHEINSSARDIGPLMPLLSTTGDVSTEDEDQATRKDTVADDEGKVGARRRSDPTSSSVVREKSPGVGPSSGDGWVSRMRGSGGR